MTPDEKREAADNIIAQHHTCVQLDWTDEFVLINHIHDLRDQLDAAREQGRDRLKALRPIAEWHDKFMGDGNYDDLNRTTISFTIGQIREAKCLVDEADKKKEHKP